MQDNIQTDLKIYKTHNYGQFSFLKENRSVKGNKALEQAILKKNKLHLNPIIINNENQVMDGQHRLTIAKKNNLPIYFMVDPDAEISDIRDVNTGRKNWTQTHYLEHFCKRQNPVYMQVKDLIENYGVGLSHIVANFMKFTKYNQMTALIRSGEMEFKYSLAYIHEVLQAYKEIIEELDTRVKLYNYRDIHKQAILKMIIHPGFKKDIFLDNMKKNPNPLWVMKDFALLGPIKEQLCIVYNHNAKKYNKWTF